MKRSSSVAEPCSRGRSARISLEQHLAARQQQHPIAHRLDLIHIVGSPQDAAVVLGGEALDLGADQLRRGRIQGRGGLIEQQQQLRPVEQRLRQRRAGLLAGGQQSALGVTQVGEVEFPQQLFDAGAQAVDAVQQAEESQILRHRQIAGQRRVNGGEVGARQGPRPLCGDVDAVDLDAARGGGEHAQHHVDGGGLAGAVGAQETDDFSAPDRKRDVIERGYAAVNLANSRDPQSRGV